MIEGEEIHQICAVMCYKSMLSDDKCKELLRPDEFSDEKYFKYSGLAIASASGVRGLRFQLSPFSSGNRYVCKRFEIIPSIEEARAEYSLRYVQLLSILLNFGFPRIKEKPHSV